MNTNIVKKYKEKNTKENVKLHIFITCLVA